MTRLKQRVKREIPVYEKRMVKAGIRGVETILKQTKTYALELIPSEEGPAMIRIGRKLKRRYEWHETTVEAVFWMAVRVDAELIVAKYKPVGKALAEKGRLR